MKNPLAKRIALYVFLGGFALLHIYVKMATQPSFEAVSAKTGKVAALFEGMTLDGRNLQLASSAKTHKLVIVSFWESWCGPCKLELPDLQNLYAAYKDQGLEMIGIYGASSDESVQQIIQQDSLTFPMINDSSGVISKPYGVEAVPTTFVIGPDLKILRSHEGIDMGLKAFVEERLKSAKNS